MSDDQFTKLFKYMQQEFEALHSELATKADDAKVERILNMLDSLLKQQETDQQERLVMTGQLDRHEAWITKASPKFKVKYD